MSAWHYEFIIDNDRLLRKVPLPKRMAKEVKEVWTKEKGEAGVLRIHRGTENRKYSIRMGERMRSSGNVQTVLSEGWSEFVSSNNLQIGDRVQFVLEEIDEMLYRVRIWHDDEEITVVDPHTVIEHDQSISDAESFDYVPIDLLYKDPFFHFTFTKGYLDKPTINVPSDFARKHFHGFKNQSPVVLYLNNRHWDATMRIKYNNNKKNKIITKCEIKKGIRKLIDGEKIEEGEKAVIELAMMDPPFLVIIFS